MEVGLFHDTAMQLRSVTCHIGSHICYNAKYVHYSVKFSYSAYNKNNIFSFKAYE